MHRARATRLPHLSTPEQREVVFHIKEDVGQLEGVRLALAVSHNKSVSSVTVRTGRQSSALMVLLEAIKHNTGIHLLHCPVRSLRTCLTYVLRWTVHHAIAKTEAVRNNCCCDGASDLGGAIQKPSKEQGQCVAH